METTDKLLSVILPSHNEEDNIFPAAERISGILSGAHIQHEIIFVNDGSTDRTWEKISEAAKIYPQIRGVRFSRCFGKEAAIYAGLRGAKGDCCAVMDCDLQHPPEKLIEMWNLWCEGYEIIEGVKRTRGEEKHAYTFAAKTFNSIISRSSGVDMSNSSDFRLLDRKAVLVLLNMPERNTFFRALSSWIGFRTAQVEFDVQPRTAGHTNWNSFRLIGYAISNLTSFSSAPLYLVIFLGIFVLFISLILGVEALYRYIIGGALEGFTTVILLQLIIGSILMISLGIIGYYISKIYEEIKARPRYIVAETLDGTSHTPLL